MGETRYRAGQRVIYKAGRGEATGRITGLDGDMATLESEAGKSLRRKVAGLAPAPRAGAGKKAAGRPVGGVEEE